MKRSAQNPRKPNRKVTRNTTRSSVRLGDVTRHGLVGGVLLGLLLLVGLLVQAVMTLPVERIVVNGEFRFLDESRVSAHLQPFLEELHTGPDLEQIRIALEEMPWVKSVDIRRRWPDLLEISVFERTPIARWRDQGLIDFDGTLFSPQRLPPQLVWPKLAGPEGRDLEVFEAYRRLSGISRNHNRELINLELDGRGKWRAELAGGTEVILGGNEIFEKMRRFLETADELQRQTGRLMARVDLRYGNGMAIAWTEMPDRVIAAQTSNHVTSNLKGEQPGYGQHTGT